MPNKHSWYDVPVTRKNERGRAKGGVLLGIRKYLQLEEVEIRKWNEDIIEARIIYNKNRWRIITIYSREIERTLETLGKGVQEEKEGHFIIGGDWNARTREAGGPIGDGERQKRETRKSVDKTINKEDKAMIDAVKERGWMILNGRSLSPL